MAMPEEINGLNHYVQAGDCRYHIKTEGGKVFVRLVDVVMNGTPNLQVTMPAANLVVVSPDRST